MLGNLFKKSTMTYRKVTRVTKPDGSVEETTETLGGPEAEAKAASMEQEVTEQFKKADEFFKTVDDAFKKLF